MVIALDRRPVEIPYDENGLSRYELLAGTYEGGIRNFRWSQTETAICRLSSQTIVTI